MFHSDSKHFTHQFLFYFLYQRIIYNVERYYRHYFTFRTHNYNKAILFPCRATCDTATDCPFPLWASALPVGALESRHTCGSGHNTCTDSLDALQQMCSTPRYGHARYPNWVAPIYLCPFNFSVFWHMTWWGSLYDVIAFQPPPLPHVLHSESSGCDWPELPATAAHLASSAEPHKLLLHLLSLHCNLALVY